MKYSERRYMSMSHHMRQRRLAADAERRLDVRAAAAGVARHPDWMPLIKVHPSASHLKLNEMTIVVEDNGEHWAYPRKDAP